MFSASVIFVKNIFVLFLISFASGQEEYTPINISPLGKICGNAGLISGIHPRTANLAEFPWVVRLEYENRFHDRANFYCTGTLVTRQLVITAAKCVSDSTMSRYNLTYIRLGEYNLDQNPDCVHGICGYPVLRLPVEDIIIHESFVGSGLNWNNNIALIRMSKGVLFTEFIRPICMPSQFNNFIASEPGDRVVVVGWGQTTQTVDYSDRKQIVPLQVSDHDRCTEKYSSNGYKLSKSELCAKTVESVDACNGFSGAPLMKEMNGIWFLEGVVSCGKECNNPDWPGIYTNVMSYDIWLRQYI